MPRLRRHVRQIVILSLPIIVARAGQLVLNFADTVMVGRAGPAELARLGFGLSLSITFIVAGVGLLMGTLAMTAQALGRGQSAEAGAVWRRSLPFALIVGVAAGGLTAASQLIFPFFTDDAALVADSGRVARIFALGLPAVMLYAATSMFLEGLRRPVAGMVIMIAANGVNVLLNWVFIFGHWGAPAMGAEGSALATSILRWLMVLAILAWVWWAPTLRRYGVRHGGPASWADGRAQRKLGYAAGASMAFELSAFSLLTLWVGRLGEVALGVHTIAMNLTVLVFMVAIGLGFATAVQVGEAKGAEQPHEMRLAGWTGLALTTITMTAGLILFRLAPDGLAAFYNDDPAVLALAGGVIAFAAWILIFDGGQTVMHSALRGLGDTWVPTLCHFTSYYVVMLPLAWLLAFRLELGLAGVWQAYLVGSMLSVALQAGRFRWLTRPPKADRVAF
ncbi:MAG: MATE family efflux transporter [Alphaproteobacteria bacterium]